MVCASTLSLSFVRLTAVLSLQRNWHSVGMRMSSSIAFQGLFLDCCRIVVVVVVRSGGGGSPRVDS